MDSTIMYFHLGAKNEDLLEADKRLSNSQDWLRIKCLLEKNKKKAM